MSFSQSRILRLLGLMTVVLACPASAQEQEILGFMNPTTRTFKPYAPALPASVRPATAGVNSGLVSVAITLANKSGFTSASAFVCGVQTYIADSTTGATQSRTYYTLATVTPSNITCTANASYSIIVEPSTTTLSVTTYVTRIFEKFPVIGARSLTPPFVAESFRPIALPASGSSTNLTFQSVI
jgi:hypothetical protein